MTFPHAGGPRGCYAGTVTWTDDDGVMAELRSWLVEQGFVVLSDLYDADHFGNQLVELARPIAVRLIRDRGQWGIEIAGQDGVWSPLLASVDATPGRRAEVLSAADQSEALRALLPQMERRASGDAEQDAPE